jgi:hypothetical protein
MENIKIEKLTTKDIESVKKYWLEDFVPDEPMLSSMKMFEGSNFFDKMVHKDLEKKIFNECIEKNASFGAWDDAGNLMGVRLGQIMEVNKLAK